MVWKLHVLFPLLLFYATPLRKKSQEIKYKAAAAAAAAVQDELQALEPTAVGSGPLTCDVFLKKKYSI